MKSNNQFVIITGMSGAGKTVAMQTFEDLGYFCVDNMPPSLLPRFENLVQSERDLNRVALVMDLRSGAFYDDLIEMYADLKAKDEDNVEIIFLESSDTKLVSRYKESRRSHPLARDGRVIDGIQTERKLLADVKEAADLVIDTTNLSPKDLREELAHTFESENSTHPFHIEVMSFGFKYGAPLDADIIMDVRFLPNPYYDLEMRNKTGLDHDVYQFVIESNGAETFYQQFSQLIKTTLPAYEAEGKSSLTIAIGCTGGQHRSVAMTERLAKDLIDHYPVNVSHRDIERHKQ